MLKKGIVLVLSTVIALVACHAPVYNQTEGNVADVKVKVAEARHKSDRDARSASPLVMKNGLYVDTTPVSLEKNPSWLHSHIVIRGESLPFSYYSRTIGTGAGTTILTKYQPSLDPTVNISVSYSGPVKGALDLIASKTGYVYSVRGSTIYWQAYVTRTFDIAFMPGGTDYLMGKKSGGGTAEQGGGSAAGNNVQATNYTTTDSSESEYSNLSAKLSVWDDLHATVKQLLSPQGTLSVSQATTSVTVKDRPANIEIISQYINNLNHNLSKQVLVKVQVLEVLLQNDYDFGINWGLVAKAFHNSPFMVNGSYGTPISITAFTPQGAGPSSLGLPAPKFPQFGIAGDGSNPSYTILFNALNQQGKTGVVSEPRAVCLNNQVSVIRIVQSTGYVASIQNTSLASSTGQTNIGIGTVTSQVTPGSVTTGLTLYLLPKIMQNRVYLQVNADLSTLLDIKVFGPTNSQVELPEISQKHFNQRSMIRSGDTLILSGFRQVRNTANANQFVNSQALGGKGSSQVNAEIIILITPIILSGSA